MRHMVAHLLDSAVSILRIFCLYQPFHTHLLNDKGSIRSGCASSRRTPRTATVILYSDHATQC